PEEPLNALVGRIERGAHVVSGAVASLIAVSRNRRLFEATRQHLVKDPDALIKLIRANIPDPAIETRLRDELYKAFPSSDNPWRREILHALEEHGSTDCIDDLEAIQYEFEPRLQTAKLARDIEGNSE